MLNNFDFDFNGESKKKKEKHKNNENGYDDNNSENLSGQENIFALIITKLKIWFNSITFTVKQIVAISIILWIIDLFTANYITFIFANVPYYSIGYFQIWRFITGNLITSGIFSLIFVLIFWVSDGKVVEKIKGSARYLIYFLLHCFIIQSISALIYYFFINKNLPDRKEIRSNGLWTYIIWEVTINCLISPESKIFLPFIPYPIKSKYFPIIILFIFFIFGGLEIGPFIAVIYGFLYSFFLQRFLEIKDESINNFENKYFRCFFGFKGYIQIDDVSTDKKQLFLSNMMKHNIDNNRDYDSDGDSDDSNNSNPYNKKLKKFVPFTGKGVKLNGSN